MPPEWWSDVTAAVPAYKGPRGGADPNATPAEVEGYIRQAASIRGIDPDIAVRVANSEGGMVPNKTGSFATGRSFFPYQLHYGGAGTPYAQYGTVAGMGNTFTEKTGWQPGDPAAWRAATDYALDAAKQQGWGAWYGARNQGITGYQGINRGAAAPAPPPATDAPEWWKGIPGARDAAFQYGRDVAPSARVLPDIPTDTPPTRELLGTRAAPATESGPDWWRAVDPVADTAGSAAGMVWPLAGQNSQTARINNPFGAPQVRSAGFTGALPAQNYGVDLGARAGTPVLAPAAGVVKQVLTTAGQHYGYGNSVTVDLGGGREVQLSHFQDPPAVRVGQRVSPGDLLGHAGMTGNATAEHLDAALRVNGQPRDFLELFGGAATARAAPVRPSGPAPAWWAAV